MNFDDEIYNRIPFKVNKISSIESQVNSSCFVDRTNFLRDILSKERVNCVIISTFSLDLRTLWEDFLCLDDTKSQIPTLVLHGDKHISISYQQNPKDHTIDNITCSRFYVNTNGDDTDEEFINDSAVRIISSFSISKNFLKFVFVRPQFSKSGESTKSILGVHHPKYILIFSDSGLHVLITTANLTRQHTIDLSWSQFFPKLDFIKNKSNFDSFVHKDNDFGSILQNFLVEQSNQMESTSTSEEDLTTSSPIYWIKKYAGVTHLCDSFDFHEAEVDLVPVVPGRDPILLSESDITILYRHSDEAYKINEPRGLPCHKCKTHSSRLRPTFSSSRSHRNHAAVVSDSLPHEKYGATRLSYLLKKHYSTLPRQLTHHDILIVQPTSIGEQVRNDFIAWLLSNYMPESHWDKSDKEDEEVEEEVNSNSHSHGSTESFLRQDSWKLIWPTSSMMNTCRARRQRRKESCSKVVTNTRNIAASNTTLSNFSKSNNYAVVISNQSCKSSSSEAVNSYSYRSMTKYATFSQTQSLSQSEDTEMLLFLKPTTLATMEPDIHHQMFTLQPLMLPLLHPYNFYYTPHYKSYARLMVDVPPKSLVSLSQSLSHGEALLQTLPIPKKTDSDVDEGEVTPDPVPVIECNCQDLAWFLLTSACLSRGAQGKPYPAVVCSDCGNIQQGYIEYKNFELGVLFHSTRQLQYRALSSTCPVHSNLLNLTSDSNCSHSMIHGKVPIHKEEGRDSKKSSWSTDNKKNGRRVRVLPVPYELTGGSPYCHPEDGRFQYRPYLNDSEELRKVNAQLQLPEDEPNDYDIEFDEEEEEDHHSLKRKKKSADYQNLEEQEEEVVVVESSQNKNHSSQIRNIDMTKPLWHYYSQSLSNNILPNNLNSEMNNLFDNNNGTIDFIVKKKKKEKQQDSEVSKSQITSSTVSSLPPSMNDVLLPSSSVTSTSIFSSPYKRPRGFQSFDQESLYKLFDSPDSNNSCNSNDNDSDDDNNNNQNKSRVSDKVLLLEEKSQWKIMNEKSLISSISSSSSSSRASATVTQSISCQESFQAVDFLCD